MVMRPYFFCTTAFFKAIGLSVKEAAQKAEQMGMLPLIPLTSVKTQDVHMINEKYLDNRHLDIDTAFLEEPHINACHWNWSFNEIEIYYHRGLLQLLRYVPLRNWAYLAIWRARKICSSTPPYLMTVMGRRTSIWPRRVTLLSLFTVEVQNLARKIDKLQQKGFKIINRSSSEYQVLSANQWLGIVQDLYSEAQLKKQRLCSCVNGNWFCHSDSNSKSCG